MEPREGDEDECGLLLPGHNPDDANFRFAVVGRRGDVVIPIDRSNWATVGTSSGGSSSSSCSTVSVVVIMVADGNEEVSKDDADNEGTWIGEVTGYGGEGESFGTMVSV